MARPSPRRTPGLEQLESRTALSAGGPGPQAQYLLELINEARTRPAAAATRATTNLDGDTQATLAHFRESAERARREIASAPARPPLAWNDRLAAAAQAHSQDQARTGVQSHTGSDGSSLATRLDRAGYVGRESAAENAFGYADSVEQGLQAFLIDWGVASRGHRNNILQPDQDDAPYREIGIGVANTRRIGFGPEVITLDFGRRNNTPAQLLGVAFADADGDRFYDPGEGRGDVTVEAVALDAAGRPTGSKATTTTWTEGGYQIPLAPGTYQVTARVGARVVRRQHVRIGTENVKVDYNLSDPWEPPAPAVVPRQSPPAPAPAPALSKAPAPAPAAPKVTVPTPVPARSQAAVQAPRPATPTPTPPRPQAAVQAPRPTTPPPSPKAPQIAFGPTWIKSWTKWTAAAASRSR